MPGAYQKTEGCLTIRKGCGGKQGRPALCHTVYTAYLFPQYVIRRICKREFMRIELYELTEALARQLTVLITHVLDGR